MTRTRALSGVLLVMAVSYIVVSLVAWFSYDRRVPLWFMALYFVVFWGVLFYILWLRRKIARIAASTH